MIAMEHLITGIAIYSPDIDVTSRIELSRGTMLATGTPYAAAYCGTAFIPREPWRPPSEEEIELLCSSEEPDGPIGSWVSIVCVPNEIVEPFAFLHEALRHQRSHFDLESYSGGKEYLQGISQATAYTAMFSLPDQTLFDGANVYANAAGMPTSTVESTTNRFLGLHVDGWYPTTLEGKIHMPNRISINLGLEDRFLLLINLPLCRVFQLLEERYPEDGERFEIGIKLRTLFMCRFPDYPVVKLRIRPSEAYIAPTENFIHDGCNTGQTSADLTFVARGYFGPRRQTARRW
jgi:hypothetical protein